MGGYGALYIAARNSKMFSAVYALSPCCLMPDLPNDTLWRIRGREALKAQTAGNVTTNFNVNIVTALGAIYTPATDKAPMFVRFPWEGGSANVVDSIARFWRDTPLEIIRNSAPSLLRTVQWAFDAGSRDAFPDIPLAARELSIALTRKGVGNTFEIFNGTHGDKIRERIETRMLPFFSRIFADKKGAVPGLGNVHRSQLANCEEEKSSNHESSHHEAHTRAHDFTLGKSSRVDGPHDCNRIEANAQEPNSRNES
jgi:hypothetical protein